MGTGKTIKGRRIRTGKKINGTIMRTKKIIKGRRAFSELGTVSYS